MRAGACLRLACVACVRAACVCALAVQLTTVYSFCDAFGRRVAGARVLLTWDSEDSESSEVATPPEPIPVGNLLLLVHEKLLFGKASLRKATLHTSSHVITYT